MAHPPPRLGAHADADGTAFAVATNGSDVELCLFDTDGRESRCWLAERTDDVRHGYLAGVGPGQRYGYRVHGPGDPGQGQRGDPSKLLLDPYARAVDGELRLSDTVVRRGAGDSAPYVPRSVVVADDFDWAGDVPPAVPWVDTVFYELHVRGFTRSHPDVPEHLRGTYAGLAHPAVLEHLVSLGVTTVELLPVHHFVSEPELTRRGVGNYWGYNSVGFFAPHGAYSSVGAGGGQVREFKAMVAALHAVGLEVVLDVVYNHTGEGASDGPTLCWRGLDDRGYYRVRHDGFYEDVTGCGNSLDLRNRRCLQMVTDSLRYWVEQMHVDGFRFDLAPTLARGETGFEPSGTFLSVLAQDPVISRVKLVAEPWDVGPGGYQLGGFPAPWAEWNDRYRDDVRDAWLGSHATRHGGGVRDLAYRLSGSSDVFEASGRGPLASVNFVTAHDGFTLHDLVSYERKRNEANGDGNRDGSDHNRSWNCGHEGPTDDVQVTALRRRMMRNLLATLLVSSGVPMITAGDETGRTQHGNNNPYCVDDETSWLSWELEPWQQDLLDWTRRLLLVRRSNRVLRSHVFFVGRSAYGDGIKDLVWFGPDGAEMSAERWFDHDLRVLGCYLSDRPAPDGDIVASSLLALLNTDDKDWEFTLPSEPWGSSYGVLLDSVDERPTPGPELEAGAVVTLAPHSLVLLEAHGPAKGLG